MASNFTATSEGMQQAANEVNAARDELKTEVTRTSDMLERLTRQGFRAPRASAAFQEYVKAWYRAISELYGRLDDIARAIDETRQGIDQRDQGLTQGVQSMSGSDGSGGGPSGTAVVASAGAVAGGGAAAAAGAAARSGSTGGGGGGAGGGVRPPRTDQVAAQPGGGTPSGGTGSQSSRAPVSDSGSMRELVRHVRQSNPSRLPGTCSHGTVAFANRYRGRWNQLTTAPRNRPSGSHAETLERYFGSTFWNRPIRPMEIRENLLIAGHGSQGILFGVRGDGTGHVLNIINYRDQVFLVDTQVNWVAKVNPFVAARMMNQERYDSLFYLPILPWT